MCICLRSCSASCMFAHPPFLSSSTAESTTCSLSGPISHVPFNYHLLHWPQATTEKKNGEGQWRQVNTDWVRRRLCVSMCVLMSMSDMPTLMHCVWDSCNCILFPPRIALITYYFRCKLRIFSCIVVCFPVYALYIYYQSHALFSQLTHY